MFRHSLRIAAALSLLSLVVASSSLRSQADEPKKPSKEREAQEKLLKSVAEKLLAVCEPVPDLEWPPSFAIVEAADVNAYATVTRKDGKIYPQVRVHEGMMAKVIQGDADRLAFVVGHELGHILKKHVLGEKSRDRTAFLKNFFTREQEVEADKLGCELAVKAGFSFQKGQKAIIRMQDLGMDYSSFEGLGVDHPSWNDRLKKMDSDKSTLWKVSSAFTNGVFLLTTEQYESAEKCFEFVTKEFPGCYEAWANLGFARLMRYCDKLAKEDIQKLGIGHIITGGFYIRAESIMVRSSDRKLWEEAKDALRESNRLKQNQTLVLANLGILYLVHPDGKDVGEAMTYLSESAKAAKDDKALDPVAHAALLMNLGVATVASGDAMKALAQLDATEVAVNKLAESAGNKQTPPLFEAALLYTRGLVFSERKDKADLEKALALFEKYLAIASPLSLYWPTAYARYEDVCKALGQEPKAKEKFNKPRNIKQRLVTGVKLPSGIEIMLGQDREEIEKKLGKGKAVRVLASQNLWRIRYEKEGVEILAADEVMAIAMVNAEAPPVPLIGQGTAAGETGQVKVGMTTAEIEKLLGEDYQPCEITAAEIYYRYYREQGLAVRLQKGQVTEVMIVQMPKIGGVGQ